MVEGDLHKQTVGRTETSDTQRGNQGSGIPREPSFSRWFDDDGTIHLEHLSVNTDSTVEDSDFELPSPHRSESENGIVEVVRFSKFPEESMHLNGGSTMEDIHGRASNGKYAPFDIENESNGDLRLSNTTSDETNSTGSWKASTTNSKSSVSSADVLKTLFFILVWYTFSTFLTLYNKTLLGDDLGKFPAPLLMNTVHFTMQAVLSKAITWYWSHRYQPTVPMSWRDYFYRVVPTALSTALDVNLSNASLVFISVTFATMCKSAAPIFLLLFAFAFRLSKVKSNYLNLNQDNELLKAILESTAANFKSSHKYTYILLESPSLKLLGIILVISVGILLTGMINGNLPVAKETEFEFWGFVFVMLAAVMSGFRWCMTQILLQVLTEYILVSVTSAVTVTIAGVVKEAVTILVAVFYFHDEFTWLKGAGLLTIMVGVSLFNWYKYQKLQKGKSEEDETAGSPLSNPDAKYVILEEMEDQDDVP
ncbi:hypothetical protein COLO4_33652 [Corchorus olitorius]|uniref:Sugar phosphate transporter domain-containing protein n=1 Tax=Corchorus olitorius TaxID=93759 RepID=A0A1R3GSD0_9ROSI|nr:hypothetical protein COLO4_33652 [Corchorus olitorius]